MWLFRYDKLSTKQFFVLSLTGGALMVIPFFIWWCLITSGVVPQVSENVTFLEIISKPQVILILLVIFIGWLIIGKALRADQQTKEP